MKLQYAGDIEQIAERILLEDERAYYNMIGFDLNEGGHELLCCFLTNDKNLCDYSKRIEYFVSGTTGMEEDEKIGVIITRLEEQLERMEEAEAENTNREEARKELDIELAKIKSEL